MSSSSSWPARALRRHYPLMWLADAEAPCLEDIGLGLGCIKVKGNSQFALPLCPAALVLPPGEDPIRRRWIPHGAAPVEPARVPPSPGLRLVKRRWSVSSLASVYALGGTIIRQRSIVAPNRVTARLQPKQKLAAFSLCGASHGPAKLWRTADSLIVIEVGERARPLAYRIRFSLPPNDVSVEGAEGDPASLACARDAAAWKVTWREWEAPLEVDVTFTRAEVPDEWKGRGEIDVPMKVLLRKQTRRWRRHYREHVPHLTTPDARLDALVDHYAWVYRANVVSLGGLLNHPFTMPKQTFVGFWAWDVCFHAMGGRWFGRSDWAWGHLLNFENLTYPSSHPGAGVVTNSAQPWGVDVFVSDDPRAPRATIMPHMIQTSAGEGTHPPHFAQALEAVWEVHPDERNLRRLLPEAQALDAWFERRRASESFPGLLVVRRWSDSGMDNSKRWGVEGSGIYETGLAEADWRLPVVAIEVNVCSVLEKLALARLLERVGRTADAAGYRAAAAARAARIHECLWRAEAGFYFDRAESDGRFVPVWSPAGFYPWLLESLPEDRWEPTTAHLFNPQRFWAQHPVPSLALDDPDFRPVHSYWQGCTWMNYTCTLLRGLLRHDAAMGWRLLDRVLDTQFQQGIPTIYENYHPHNGTGYDAANFGWSLLMFDVVCKDLLGLSFGSEGLVVKPCRAPPDWKQWSLSNLSSAGKVFSIDGKIESGSWKIRIKS